MTTRKRNIEIEVLVDDKRARQNLQNIDNATAKTAKGFGQLSGALKVAAGAFIATHAVDFTRDLVNASSDLAESINAVNVTFGDAADEVLKLGENAAKSLGLANKDFNQLSVSFAAFVDKIAGPEGQSVDQVLAELTTRIADFASVMNLDVAEAAEKFRSGLAGESEPLRQFGIDLSAAAVELKATELGLMGANDELTEGEKILVRYRLIMEQTEKTAGDFANTADGLANQQRILNAEWENSKAKLGDGLVPLLQELLAILNPIVSGLGEVATAWGKFQKLMDQTMDSGDPFAILSSGIARLVTKGALPNLIDLLSRAKKMWDDLFAAADGIDRGPGFNDRHRGGGSSTSTTINVTSATSQTIREQTEIARRAGPS